MATRTLSAEHKARMAQGRRETRIVESYLDHLERRSLRKKQPSPQQIEEQARELERQLADAAGIERLSLLQAREDLQRLALELEPEDDSEDLEKHFIAVAASYAERKGVSYSTWREFGVAKDVLAAAGIARTRRPNQKS